MLQVSSFVRLQYPLLSRCAIIIITYNQYSRVKSSNWLYPKLTRPAPTGNTMMPVVFFRAPSHPWSSPMFAILFVMGGRWPYDAFLGKVCVTDWDYRLGLRGVG